MEHQMPVLKKKRKRFNEKLSETVSRCTSQMEKRNNTTLNHFRINNQ